MSLWKQIGDQYNFNAECTPMGELRSVTPNRLVGTTFVGNTGTTPSTGVTGTDPNFWTGTCANSATIAQSSTQVLISSGSNSAASAIFQTVRVGRYTGGQANRFRCQIMLGDTGVTNNTRRWGCFNGTNGAYFQLSGTTLTAEVRKNNTPTTVATLTAPTTNITSYEIYYTNSKVYFVISDILVATHSATTSTWTDTTNLPCRIDNINSGAGVTNSTISVRVATIYRLGELYTNEQYSHLTTAATTVLKYGAGKLHRIAVNDMVSATACTIYDNVTAGAPIIGVITPGAKAVQPFTMEYDLPFATGLTIVTTGTWDLTIVYE
jgi:hypothetical protein